LLLLLLPGLGFLLTSTGSAGDVQECLAQFQDSELFDCSFGPTLSSEQLLKSPAAPPSALASALYLQLLAKVGSVHGPGTSFPNSLCSPPAFLPRPPPCS